ncbi:MAG: hypothetical protein HY303_21650 [Candidatus Wallbacteria bacterium]|nr:hypothetical protein [Candidatus Wallbacteria bacterium]
MAEEEEEEADARLARLAAQEKFLYFTKGVYPCLFMVHVKEGFARFEVRDESALQVLLDYCVQKSLQVEWVQAILNDEFHTHEYEEFPGGKYIAHHLGEAVLDELDGVLEERD